MSQSPERASTFELAADALLGGRPHLTLAEVAEALGAPAESVRAYWRGLGFADAPDGVAWFTDEDLAAMRHMFTLIERDRITERTARTLTTAQGHSMDRLVLWQVEALVEEVAARYDLDDVSARLVVLDRITELQGDLESQLLYTWRRQLAALLGRFENDFARSSGMTPAADELPLERAVGFLDMVGYTSRTVQLTRGELAAIVREFETTARDVVAEHGARVVKTVGDAVLFVADDLRAGARVAADLVTTLGEANLPVRGSVVWGRVLSRSGDIFGPIVNLASRLNDVAPAGTVVVDDVSAAMLAGSSEFELTELEPVSVQGLGVVNPVRLARRPRG